MFIWQHSYFIKEKEIYYKDDIDVMNKSKKYSENTSIEFNYVISSV